MLKALKALLSSVARTIEFVWEGGRYIVRLITGSTPVEPHVSAAQELAEAELDLHFAMDRAAAADERKAEAEYAVGNRWPTAFAVKEYLWTADETWSFEGLGIEHLPPNVRSWVLALTPEQVQKVRQDTHLSDLEAHLDGTRPSRTLPKLTSTADLIAAAEAAAHEREFALAVLEDLIEEEPRGRRAA